MRVPRSLVCRSKLCSLSQIEVDGECLDDIVVPTFFDTSRISRAYFFFATSALGAVAVDLVDKMISERIYMCICFRSLMEFI